LAKFSAVVVVGNRCFLWKVKDMNQIRFYPVCSIDDLPAGERLMIDLDDKPVVIFNLAGGYYAIDDVCTHDDGPLGEGEVEGCEIICPRHGARFDVRTGKVLALPAVQGVQAYPIRVKDGRLEIGVAE
jgi:3-phenylpropionate/trans-cinnamate dioxygenase ferredoxin component